MSLKKIIGWLHLWLGLSSGLVMFALGITGCLYVFMDEIEPIIVPYRYVGIKHSPYLLPSQFKKIAERALPGKTVQYVSYENGKAADIGLSGKGYSLSFYADPYTGKQLHIRNYLHDFDFFDFVLRGHRALWLPYDIGHYIVDAGVLIFIALLISGIVLWWPKNLKKANRDKSFKIKWRAKFKRLNYDLHNVLGFYAMLVLLVIALTGLAFGYEWFEKSVYLTFSGGNELPEFKEPLSDSLTGKTFNIQAVDKLYVELREKSPKAAILVYFPEKRSSSIQFNVNYQPGKTHDLDLLFFDQYSLKPLPGTGVFKKRFRDAALADQVDKLNYDMHTGELWGLPTKILAFFASLICASLPVTGFYVWWGKKKKKYKKPDGKLKKVFPFTTRKYLGTEIQ